MRTFLRFVGLAVLVCGAGSDSRWGGRAAGQEADRAAAPARKGYELRMLGVGNTYQGMRFKLATGETWQIAGGRWLKIPEAGPLPAGDYDVLLIPAGESFLAVRIDRSGGATWLFQARRWNRVGEPPAGAKPNGPGARGGGYRLRHARVGDRLHVLRFHTRTGAAVVETDAYQDLAETGPVPPGDYDVTMIAGEDDWVAFRIDRSTGTTWLLRARQWVKVDEPD